jgi:hypothetical protein
MGLQNLVGISLEQVTPVETSLHKSFTSRKPRCDIGLKGSEPVMY